MKYHLTKNKECPSKQKNQDQLTKRQSKSTPTAEKQTDKRNDSAAFDKQISTLEASLEQAQEQIAGLQEDIKVHQARIFELKDELEASQKETAAKTEALAKATEELETAKETIRKITAASPQEDATKAEASAPNVIHGADLATRNVADQDTANPETSAPNVIHGADLATNRNTLTLRNRPSRSYKAIPEYAIQRGEQNNSMLSDDDIGWVD